MDLRYLQGAGEFENLALATPSRFQLSLMLPALLRELTGGNGSVSILDVGCGSGRYSDVVAGAGVGGSYVGVDIVPHDSWEHRRASAPTGLTVDFRAHDAHRLSELGSHRFDAAFAITTFEHFERDGEVAGEVAKVLRPGGRFLVVVPSHPSLALYWRHGFRRYSPAGLRALLVGAGFAIDREFDVGGLPSFLAHATWNTFWRMGTYAGKVALYGAFAGRSRAKRLAPVVDRFIVGLQWAHQLSSTGRTLHEIINRALAVADPKWRGLPALIGVLATLAK